jgi:FixJ family two-component response regulator
MPHNAVSRGEIFVMDEDAVMRETLSAALQQEGYEVVCFADGAALLSLVRTRMPACIFLEMRISGASGLDTLKKLRAEGHPAPVFIMSGQGNIAMAVDAIRNGALDFIEKPFRSSDIVTRVNAAIGTLSHSGRLDCHSTISSFRLPDCKPLTLREQQVLAQIVTGASSKEAGRQLGISSRTIEDHRARILRKTGVRNTTELIRRMLGENLC